MEAARLERSIQSAWSPSFLSTIGALAAGIGLLAEMSGRSIAADFLFAAAGASLGASLMLRKFNKQAFDLSRRMEVEERGGLSEKNAFSLPAVQSLFRAHEKILHHYQEAIEKLSDETDMLVDRYEVLTANLAASIVIRDSKGTIAYCSPYTEVLTGYAVDEIYGCREGDFLHGIVHPEDREQYTKAMRVNAYGEAFQFRYRFVHKSGIEMWAETRTVPIMDEQGEVTSFLSITFDVTGLIRRQQLIEEKNRDLEDFSYMISHDLKAPIFTIKGMLQILEEDGGSQANESGEAIQHITAAASRLEQLVQGVVEYSRIATRENLEEAVELNQVLEDIRAEFQGQLQAAGATFIAPEYLPAVRADRLKLYQIFSNLIGNSIKYRSAERPLIIEVYENSGDNSRLVRICVKDNGTGIPKNRLEDVFRPFQRAHGREIEGTGIGLACVKKLVTLLGGDAAVESQEGRGSTFSVTLPRADEYVEANRKEKNETKPEAAPDK